MKIAVLNYEIDTVDIFVVERSYIQDKFDGDIEKYLIEEHGYKLESIDWKENIRGINIIESDDLLQLNV